MRVELNQPFGAERARFLDQASLALFEAESREAAIRITPQCALPDLADLAILVLDRENSDERIEVAHIEADREAGIKELLVGSMQSIRRIASHEFQAGRQFRWFPTVGPVAHRLLARTDPLLIELLGTLDVNSLIVVPLRIGSRLLGALALARTTRERPYQAADLAVAQVLARKAAVVISNAELQHLVRVEAGRRSRLEDALQKWIRVFDVAGWGAAIVDASDLRIEAVNPAFSHMHGYSHSDSLIGQLYTSLLHPGQQEETATWETIQEQPHPYESMHVRPDGTLFPVLTDVTALNMGQRATSFVVTVQDVTELKRTEERLRRAQRLEAVGRLAGGVAHEVNNMMTIIMGFSDLLFAATNLPSGRMRDVEEIRKAAVRTARITQQLLAFSRQQVLQPADLKLGEVVGEMASVLRHLLPANIRIETELDPGPTVRVDRAQLDQVLINLAFNARDAMPMGGAIRLQTESRHFDAADGRRLIGIPIPEGQYAVLCVRDTGTGMDSATQSQIFEPFFTTKPGAGTGLGLATVYGIVKQSGGFVWVESVPGEGTSFTVCFPQLPKQHVAEAEPPRDVSASRGPRNNASILIIEDEDGVRELARRVLEDEGHRVLDVRTAAEAIETLDRPGTEIHVVLSDVIVPDMATIQLEQRIMQRRPNVPILYMSGYSREDVVGRGLVPAARPFIQKPFTGAELVDEVTRELERAKPGGGRVTA